MCAAIEKRIRPPVDAMNETGRLKTVGYCEDHLGILGPRPAYVYFKSALFACSSRSFEQMPNTLHRNF